MVNTTTLDVPSLGSSALCPVVVLAAMLAKFPSSVDSPLFQIPHGQVLKPLTDSAARKHLKTVSALLGLPRSLTFRRDGASWAFARAVAAQAMQAQGTWTSNCVWRYTTLPSSHSYIGKK